MPTALLLKKEEPIDLPGLIRGVRESAKGYGAIVTFTGVVRGRTHEGGEVSYLEYEVFEEAARRSMEQITEDLSAIRGVLGVAICHRYGRFCPGEEVLYVVIATERSSVAFEALKLAVSRTKHEVPIWKKEVTPQGGCWVETG